jgi:hypothetical protein
MSNVICRSILSRRTPMKSFIFFIALGLITVVKNSKIVIRLAPVQCNHPHHRSECDANPAIRIYIDSLILQT